VLKVSRQVTNKQDNTEEPTAAQDEPDSGPILLSNIPPGTTEDTLIMYLENRRRCDGGPVQSVDFDASRRTATVTFKDHQSEFCISVNRPVT